MIKTQEGEAKLASPSCFIPVASIDYEQEEPNSGEITKPSPIPELTKSIT